MTRGQGAFEYLLILGGSVLLAAVMLVLVQGNLGSVSPGVNMSVGTITKLTAAVGADVTCNDCDAVFVNEGQPLSVSNGMLQTDSVDSNKIVDGSIKLVDVDTTQIQKRVATNCPAGTNVVRTYENGTTFCDAGSWVINGNNITNRNTDMVIIPTLNVTKNLYAPGIGAGSINITYLYATNASITYINVTKGYIDNLTVRNIYVIDNAVVGISATATTLNARSNIYVPGFNVTTEITSAKRINADQLCLRRSPASTTYTCIGSWTDLLDVLFAQVG
ncbi:MAG: hypothetical protein WCX64_05860 [Candidatus Micrarchaeia archaeon]